MATEKVMTISINWNYVLIRGNTPNMGAAGGKRIPVTNSLWSRMI
jgi:hypothetical protein